MVELLSEPLYILAQLRLRLQLRVFAEASATLARGVATLALLKLPLMDVGISLSVAQVCAASPCHRSDSLATQLSWHATGVAFWRTTGCGTPASPMACMHRIFKGLAQLAASCPMTVSHPAQCIYAAVTLAVYVGGMAGDLPWTAAKQASDQLAAFTGPDQASHTVKQQKPECAASEQQPIFEASAQAPAAALREPEAEEDEDWELLAASDPPKSSLQPSIVQQGAAVYGAELGRCLQSGLPDGPARAATLTGTSGDTSSAAKADLRSASAQSEAPETAGGCSRGVHEGGMDMHAETEGGSLLFPRSASAAAQLSEGVDMQASDSREQAPYGQPSDELEHDKLRQGGQQQSTAATDAAAAAAFDREEVLWRCAIFSMQVRPPPYLCFPAPFTLSEASHARPTRGLRIEQGSPCLDISRT